MQNADKRHGPGKDAGRIHWEESRKAEIVPRLLVKRLVDIVGAASALLLLAPLLLATYLAVRSDGGPAFFGHTRIGFGGRRFRCWKFRSMVVDAEDRLHELLASDGAAREEWERTFKLRNDPRISRLGRFLRVSSIDELPQLYNVLIGDMSLIGPRPITAKETIRYRDAIQAYYSVRPGLTGLWQVSGRSDTDYEQRVRLDVQYVEAMSLRLDLIIMARTLNVVLNRRGAV